MQTTDSRTQTYQNIDECIKAMCEAAALNELLCRLLLCREIVSLPDPHTSEGEKLQAGLVELCANAQKRLLTAVERYERIEDTISKN